MNKSEFIGEISKRVPDMTKKDVEAVTGAVFDTITETLASGDKISVPDFGTFEARHRAARNGRNPQTGESMQIAAAIIPTFKAGKVMRGRVGGEQKTAAKPTGRASATGKAPAKAAGGGKSAGGKAAGGKAAGGKSTAKAKSAR